MVQDLLLEVDGQPVAGFDLSHVAVSAVRTICMFMHLFLHL
jgi:hypothetical protein